LEFALAAFDKAVEIDPDGAEWYADRGLVRFYQGDIEKALSDLARSHALDPEDADTALWLEVVRRRAGLPGDLAESARRLDMTEWPAPIVRLLLGQSTSAEALVEAQHESDAVVRVSNVCQIEFYAGQLALLRDDQSSALPQFERAVNDCSHRLTEWAAAKLELTSVPAAITGGTDPTSGPMGEKLPSSSPAATVVPAGPPGTPSPAASSEGVKMASSDRAPVFQ
jgi:lipoprotein NlpI